MITLINYHRKRIEACEKTLAAIQKRMDKDPLTRAREKRCRITQLSKEIAVHTRLLAVARCARKQLIHLKGHD